MIALATVPLLIAGVLLGGVTMAIGMLVHEVSVLVVILNAMRLMSRRQASGSLLVGTQPVSKGRSIHQTDDQLLPHQMG